MDIAALGGALGAIKALTGMTKATAEAIVDEQQRAKLYEIRQGLMDLQERVLDDQQSRMDLVASLESTKKEVETLKARKSKLDSYQLLEISPGKYLYYSTGHQGSNPLHFACPNCFNTKEQIGILQEETGYGDDCRETKYQCSACEFVLFALPR